MGWLKTNVLRSSEKYMEIHFFGVIFSGLDPLELATQAIEDVIFCRSCINVRWILFNETGAEVLVEKFREI